MKKNSNLRADRAAILHDLTFTDKQTHLLPFTNLDFCKAKINYNWFATKKNKIWL